VIAESPSAITDTVKILELVLCAMIGKGIYSRHRRQVVDQESKTMQATKFKGTTLPIFMRHFPLLIFSAFIGQQTSKYMLS
jgi:hypothetical protein